MKRIIILFVILLLTSACDIKYNLKISKNLKFEEEIIVNGSIREEFGNLEESDVQKYFAQTMSYYKNYKLTKNEADKDNFNITLESKVEGKDNFLKLESLTSMYQSEIYVNDKNNYVFNFKTLQENPSDYDYELTEFDTLTISIYSEKKIINSNADKIMFNNYIWELKDSKYKDIYFELTDNNAFIIKPVVLIILTVLGLSLIAFYLINKSKKNNEI